MGQSAKSKESWGRLVKTLAEQFCEDAYNEGYRDAVDDAKEYYASSVSDGLRHGSSECGKTMNKFKRNKKNK